MWHMLIWISGYFVNSEYFFFHFYPFFHVCFGSFVFICLLIRIRLHSALGKTDYSLRAEARRLENYCFFVVNAEPLCGKSIFIWLFNKSGQVKHWKGDKRVDCVSKSLTKKKSRIWYFLFFRLVSILHTYPIPVVHYYWPVWIIHLTKQKAIIWLVWFQMIKNNKCIRMY